MRYQAWAVLCQTKKFSAKGGGTGAWILVLCFLLQKIPMILRYPQNPDQNQTLLISCLISADHLEYYEYTNRYLYVELLSTEVK